jgi:hypothetical protein
MSITITLPTVELKTITRALASDWGPALEAAAIRLGAVAALAYTLGLLAGMRWHQLLAWLQQCQLQLLARLGLPGGSNGAPDHFVGASEMVTTPVVPKPVATTNGAELLPAPNAASVTTPANVAPPGTDLIHISDPMAKAVRMVCDGKSHRLAAHICGVSRTSLQRVLKA